MLSTRTQGLARSPTVAAAERARALRDQGRDIVSLTAGEPLIAPPDHVIAATAEAPRKGFTKYPPVAGFPDLRKAIARQYESYAGVKVDPQQIVVSAGAKQAVWNALLALVSPGDRVLMPTPIWSSFAEMVKLAQGETVFLPTSAESRFRIDLAALDKVLTHVSGFLFNTPTNPMGATFTMDELAGIAEVLRRHPNVYVLVDEIYARIYFAGDRAPALLRAAPDLASRTVVADGVSKSYSMTGYRIGWTLAWPEAAQAISDLQGQTTSGAAAVSQRAALAAIEGPQDFVTAQRDSYKARCRRASAELNRIEGVSCFESEGAFYAFPNVSGLCARHGVASSQELADRLLEEEGLALNSGEAFFAPGYLRFSLAPSDREVDEGLRRFTKWARSQG